MCWGIFGVVLGRAALEAVPGQELGAGTGIFTEKCRERMQWVSVPSSQIPAAEDRVRGSVVANKKQRRTWSDNLFFLQRVRQSRFETRLFIRL